MSIYYTIYIFRILQYHNTTNEQNHVNVHVAYMLYDMARIVWTILS